MIVNSIAACTISFSMTCNGISIGTGYQAWSNESPSTEASADLKALTSRMYSRVWANRGASPVTANSKMFCNSVWLTYSCGELRAGLNFDRYNVDDVEFALIYKLWGPFFNNAPLNPPPPPPPVLPPPKPPVVTPPISPVIITPPTSPVIIPPKPVSPVIITPPTSPATVPIIPKIIPLPR